jgi:LacI family transcriptional regulator
MYDRQNIDNMWYYDQSILTEWLLSLPKPIAIMACDDNQGNILLQACELCGLHVPFDVALLGVDNDEILCNMSNPSMSTVNVDIEGGGADAAAMIDLMVKDPSYKGEDIVLKPLVVVERLSSSLFATNDKEILAAFMEVLSLLAVNEGNVVNFFIFPFARLIRLFHHFFWGIAVGINGRQDMDGMPLQGIALSV